MTRWNLRDLTARVIKAEAQRGGEEWKVIEFPAILPDEEPLWPEFWSLKELTALKNELPNGKWMAQYMQNPISDSTAIIKREWWREWEADSPPACDFIIQSWDTAHETKTINDYSTCTTWGVWYNEEDNNIPHVILLDVVKERMEFPELKKRAYEQYMYHNPDALLIEKKAAGAPLIQELRRMGISAQEYSPGKGQDKISRLNSVADLFASGIVWAPATRWAEELIDEVAAFPAGEHDDLVDAMTLALMRFRQGGFLRLPTDEPDEIKYFKSRRHAGYY
jgi:predicted phage terminase large subunit-like protein